MLDCKVDVNDKDMPVELEECIAEFRRFFYQDHHHIYLRILKHFRHMLEHDLVVDASGSTMNNDSPAVKAFLETMEVRQTLIDDELFVYLYDNLCNLNDLKEEDGW